LARFGAPVLVENEANLGAVGECMHGSARGAGDVLFVAIGAGVGAGIVIDGRLYRGATGAAGEVGFLRRSGSAPPHQLELEAAGPAIVRRYHDAGGGGDAQTAGPTLPLSERRSGPRRRRKEGCARPSR